MAPLSHEGELVEAVQLAYAGSHRNVGPEPAEVLRQWDNKLVPKNEGLKKLETNLWTKIAGKLT